ncbi:hypothetical protein EV216_11220 [Rhodovulum steppense]|uniref:Uncharacterized protein n=1 Tax=Rhodovulum steppense TaxID=540251 RepID=A0A4R1YUF0_9RHOB|nr:hypothetical protein EV216_11220 [Rhodovulum steppense]
MDVTKARAHMRSAVLTSRGSLKLREPCHTSSDIQSPLTERRRLGPLVLVT